MELLLKRVLVMIITISVAVPSIYFTLGFYSNSQYEKNPVNYIPSSANFAGMIESSFGTFYVYVENYSVGVVASISVFVIPQIVDLGGSTSNMTSNITTNTTLTYYEEYRGISIFELEGVNASAVLQSFVGQEAMISGFLNMTSINIDLGNLTFYIASPQNSLSIIGSASLVKESIDASLNHSNIQSVKNVTFNTSCNVSLYYYPPPQSGFTHVSLNMSQNYTEIYLGFWSLNSNTLLSISTLAVKYGIQVQLHENSIELIVNRGIWSISEFIHGIGGLSQVTGGIPA